VALVLPAEPVSDLAAVTVVVTAAVDVVDAVVDVGVVARATRRSGSL